MMFCVLSSGDKFSCDYNVSFVMVYSCHQLIHRDLL